MVVKIKLVGFPPQFHYYIGPHHYTGPNIEEGFDLDLDFFEKYLEIPVETLQTNITLYHGFIKSKPYRHDRVAFYNQQDGQHFINKFLTPYLVMVKLMEV